MNRSSLRPLPVHIFLVGLYPLFFLWNENFDQIPIFALSRVLVFSIGLILAAFLVSLLVFRNLHKAGIFTSVFLLLFYAYGHLFPLLDKKAVFDFVIGRHRYLLAGMAVLLVIAAVILLAKKPPLKLTTIFNVSSSLLLGIVLVSVILPYVQNPGLIRIERNALNPLPKQALAQTSPATGRDVYYIVLDGYSRQDLLKEEQGLDNSDFVQGLRDLGFQVQDCAQSNYGRTAISLVSSLNMDYLEPLGLQADPNRTGLDYEKLAKALQHSLVRQKFEEMGYQFITFKGVYNWLNIQDSDLYIDNDAYRSVFDRQETVNFQYLFLRTSALRYLFDKQAASPQDFEKLPAFYLRFIFPASSVFSTREYKQYQANLFDLEQLKEVAKLPGNKFVYAHLYITHQPYVFNPDGSFRWPPLDTMEAYNDQVRFVDQRMIETVTEIIRDSAVPPVIVIQGDHSFFVNTHDRMKILNAYYLPDNGGQKLYPQITPVNTFRLIFDTYFGGDYPLLEDHSYYSEESQPYRFEEVPITCPAGN